MIPILYVGEMWHRVIKQLVLESTVSKSWDLPLEFPGSQTERARATHLELVLFFVLFFGGFFFFFDQLIIFLPDTLAQPALPQRRD